MTNPTTQEAPPMTDIQIGTKLVVSPASKWGAPPNTDLKIGDLVEVLEVETRADSFTVVKVTGGDDRWWDMQRFEVAPTPDPVTVTRVTVLPMDVSVFDLPRRPYDFNLGDRRFHDQGEAVAWSDAQALHTGRRRMVRVDSSPHFVTLYLSQEIGS